MGAAMGTIRLGCVALLTAAAGIVAAQAQPPATTPERSTLERCRDFCTRIYGLGSVERSQCADACTDAETCARQCGERYPAGDGRHVACSKRCMRTRALPGS